MRAYRESKHIYGVSALALGGFLTLFLFIYAWTGIFSGGTVTGATSFYNLMFVGSLLGIISLKTVNIGYTGENRGGYLLYGMGGSFALSMIFGFLGASTLFYNMLLTTLMAAIAEEFMTRGFLYPFFTRLRNQKVLGAFISTSLWVVLHTVVYGSNLIALVYLFANGLLMTYVMEKSQSLDVPLAIHLLNNLFVGLILGGLI